MAESKNSNKKRKFKEVEEEVESSDETSKGCFVTISELLEDEKVSNSTILGIRHLPIAYRLIYQVILTLIDSKYTFWRMIVISGTVTLDNLHKIIQLTMNWDDLYSYKFITTDDQKIFKGNRKGLSSVQTKFIDHCPLPGDSLKYNYGNFNFNLVVDKVNAVSTVDAVPRCVDGVGGLFPETIESMESYIESIQKIKAVKKSKEKLENVDLDSTNMRFYGKRFGKNTTVNKIPRQGPMFWHHISDTPAQLDRIRLQIYKTKLE